MNKHWMIHVVALVAAAPMSAQDVTARGDTFDLNRAVVMARDANPRLAAASAEARAATARIGPAGALPDPMLTFGASRMMPGFVYGGDPLSMNQVMLTQSLPVNGSLGLRRSAVRADSARVAGDRAAVVLLVERDVRARYWELYHADRALEVMDRTLGVLRDLNAIANTMYSVGQTPQSDVVRSQLAITRMRQEVEDMRLRRFTAAASLNALLARPAEAPVLLPADPHASAPMHALDLPPLPPLDTLLAIADSTNPELAAARAGVRSAQASEALARRLLLPDLAVGVAYGQRPSTDDMLSLQVGVSIPVFARSRQLRQRDEARAMLDAAEQVQRERRIEVHTMLATAWQEAQTARRQVETYAASLLPQAVASYEASLSAYRVGRVDFPTVLDAQMALLQDQHDLHGYEAMFGTAVAELDRLLGQPFGSMAWDRGCPCQ